MEHYEKINLALKPLDAVIGVGLNGLKRAGLYESLQDGVADMTRNVLRRKFERENDLEVTGLENIPDTGGAILAANHQSWYDTQVLGVSCPRFVHSRKRLSGSPVRPRPPRMR